MGWMSQVGGCRVKVVEAIYRPLLAGALADAVTLQTNL